MTLQYDPDFVCGIEYLQPILSSRTVPELHDVKTRRENLESTFGAAFAVLPWPGNVVQEIIAFASYDGTEVSILYSHRHSALEGKATAAIIHAHAGGMIAGSAETFAKPLALLAAESTLPIFSIDYRRAPEHPHPTPTEDVFSALVFVRDNATRFNIDPARIAVMGESAGGGIAAGVALMARDRGLFPPLAKQILTYPMIDDCNLAPNPALVPFAFWSYDSNRTGWTALLGAEKVGQPEAEISPYAAPARAKDVARLPRTYMDTGDLDIFKDEIISYVARLARANIPVEFHLYPGVPHAFDYLAPDIPVTRAARRNRIQAMTDF